MPWLGLPAWMLAAYLGAKFEGSRLWTAFSVFCWTVVSLLILGAIGLAFGFLIAVARVALTP